MIVIHQARNQGPFDRLPIPKEDVLVAYSAEATEMDPIDGKSFPSLPKNGFGCNSRYGDWFVYLDWTDCKRFVDANPFLQVTVKVGDLDGPPGAEKLIPIQLTTKAVNLSGPLKDGRIGDMQSSIFTVHVVIHVGNGILRDRVRMAHFTEAWDEYGFQVYKTSVAGTKIDGQRIKGKGLQGGAFHFNVRPKDGNIYGTIWPYHIKIFVEDTVQYLSYKIFPHPELEGRLCLNGCHRYYENAAHHIGAKEICRLECTQFGKGKGARPPPGQPSGEQLLKQKIDAKKEEALTMPCNFFTGGRCLATAHGKTCKYQHIGDAAAIDCQFFGKCHKTKCGYNHPPPPPPGPPPQASPSATLGDMHIGCALRQRLKLDPRTGRWTVSFTPPVWHTPRRKGRVGWDSTLGYPGEGPVRMAGLNIDGLNETRDMHRLIGQAIARRLDIIFLQEHHLQPSRARDLIGTLARKGWGAAISSPQAGKKGGTAILYNEETVCQADTVVDRNKGDSLGGRACAIDAKIGGHSVRLVSLYVPAQATERGEFIKDLKNIKILNAKTICQADWNYVHDLTNDLYHLDTNHSPTPYPHTRTYESYLKEVGLEDTFRLLHGRDAKDYTRRGATVWTRLDRYYGPCTNSDFRWIKVESDPLFYRAHSNQSDHLAVMAEVEWASQRKPTKADRRIDPRVFKIPQVRSTVINLWKAVFTELPPGTHGYSTPWVTAKATVSEYLLNESYTSSPERQAVKQLEGELILHHKVASVKGPTTKLMDLILSKEAELEENRKKIKSSVWWNYIQSLGEEVSSKRFYKTFRRKLSNSDISSLHITPDWDHPENKQGTTDDPNEIADQLNKYYTKLFDHKPSSDPERMLALLKTKRVPARKAKIMDAPFEEKDVTAAIRRLGKGKSPGPDTLPAEFYQDFEFLVAGHFLGAIQESIRNGSMAPDIRSGIITLIYKKGDPREVRNYRPITLLNVDYKIFAHMLVSRLKVCIDDIVTPCQLGFVPGREITESLHFLKLLQAKLDEDDLEGLIVALDWEKAFDRVSWDYLHQATEALGFGKEMRGWIEMIYNKKAPPLRSIRANGIVSDQFEIRSGVPQGCPASPLIFLLVAEALTRAVVRDKALKGVTIDGTEHKITQFADDTQLILGGYKYLRRMWKLLEEYEGATGMLANKKKFEGIRCGALKRKPVPLIPALGTHLIKWVKPNEYVRILGIPFWEKYDITLFYEELYDKTRAIIASWRNHDLLTIVGKGMLVNSMIYGRFRFYVNVEPMPKHITQALISDAQALIWNKNEKFEGEEMGSVLVNKRWMKSEAQHLPRKVDLGGGILDWEAHVEALQIHRLLKYRDASRGAWKQLLDIWLDREQLGRGAIFALHRAKDLTQSTHSSSSGESKLPKFWAQAIKALQKRFTLIPADPNHWSLEAVRAMPVWFNPLFKVPAIKNEDFWRSTLRLNTIKDLFKDDGSDYSKGELLDEIDRLARVEGDYVKIKSAKWVKIKDLLKQWDRILFSIPLDLVHIIQGRTRVQGYSAVSQKLMRNLGWTPGTGLGKHSQGIPDPVSGGTGQSDRSGLGLRPKPKGRKKQNDIVAIWAETHIRYGRIQGIGLQIHEPNIKGQMIPTGEVIHYRESDTRKTVKWKNKVLGIAESTFPHPAEWRLDGIHKDLDRIEVKDLTTAITRQRTNPPTCIDKWTEKLGDIDIRGISERYSVGIASPKDFGSHFKLILHRHLWTNPHNPNAPSEKCRLCGLCRESVQHLGGCVTLKPIYEELRLIDGGDRWDDPTLNLLGQFKNKKTIPPGVSLVHFIVWKFILIHMTHLSLHKTPFRVEEVLKQAKGRISRKIETAKYQLQCIKVRAEARQESPKHPQVTKWMRGIGEIAEGVLSLKRSVKEWLNV